MSETTRRGFLLGSAAAAAGGAFGAAEYAQARAFSPELAARLNHDLHTHTVFSDGAHPVALHVLEARAFELEAMAVTDHYAPGGRISKSDEQFDLYLAEIEKARAGQDDTIVLKGVEASALDTTGRISIDERHAARLEWILCHLGGEAEGTLRHTPADKRQYVENVVRTYMGLCDVEYLNVIAHPFNTGLTKPAAFPEDYPPHLLRELAGKMAEKKKVFDVMNDTIYWFHKTSIPPRELTAQYVEVVKIFAAAGVTFQVSSDDHRTGVGNTRWSELVIARAGVPLGQIIDPKQIARK